jgi:hypothetical protein
MEDGSMKRFAFFASAVVALTLGVAACSDSPTQPVQPTAQQIEAADPTFGLYGASRFDRAAFACAVFANAVVARNPSLSRQAIFDACMRVAARIRAGESICQAIRPELPLIQDPRLIEAITRHCARSGIPREDD